MFVGALFGEMTSTFCADHVAEQEMEIEALQAILMDDFKGLSYTFLSFSLEFTCSLSIY